MSDEQSELRASDADRERIAAVLGRAFDQGRITLHEFDERMAELYRTRTYGELTPLVADLPEAGEGEAHQLVTPSSESGEAPEPVGESRRAVAVLGASLRRGRWRIASRFSAFAFWGGGRIDLREASFSSTETVIRCFAVMGGVKVFVPEDVEVRVRGIGLMGGFDRHVPPPTARSSKRVTVSGMAFWGGVKVRRVPRKKR
ncbi:DUF1707 domain-containing protein [Actinopolyspora mortivallis]|uniref:Uncharacterized protein n=1 Tax=Actinopolyspora mortivallis TaxID=33906 RepID=A0A2T0GUI4_ACTMO|nr:DUF1707 domain-containing protein [Actinopolyspora mortivallis]PRW62761.1 hypothetical protein CEP50_13565 [Actinopolyspora mortivallis]